MAIVRPDGTVIVRGRVSGRERIGNQVAGMPDAICHACGLGYRCHDDDCPNDTPNPMWSANSTAGKGELK